MTYEWRRWVPCNDAECVEGCPVGPGGYEFAVTSRFDRRPKGKGWKRVYSFGVGSVKGAGTSPARPSRKSHGGS